MLTLLERPVAGGLCLARGVTWSPDGRYIAAVLFHRIDGSHFSTVLLWTPWESASPRVLKRTQGRIMSLAFTGDSQFLLGGTAFNEVSIWPLNAIESVFVWQPVALMPRENDGEPHTASEYYQRTFPWVAGTPNSTVAIAYGAHHWNRWDVTEPGEGRPEITPNRERLDSVRTSADGKYVVFSTGRSIGRFEIRLGYRRCTTVAEDRSGCERVVLSRCAARYAYISGRDLVVGRFGRGRLSQRRTRLKGHEAPVYAAAFGPDAQIVLTGGHDGTTRVWDIDHRQELAKYDWDVGRVTSMAVSPDGGTVVVGGDGANLLVMWDLD